MALSRKFMRFDMRVFRNLGLAIFLSSVFFPGDLLAQEQLSDAQLKAKINSANPNKTQHQKWLIFVCHKYEPVCQTLDTEYKGLQPGQVEAYLRKGANIREARAAEYENRKRTIKPDPDTGSKENSTDPNAPKVQSYFLVRRTLEDISTLSAPKAVKDVTGAQFSYNRDNITLNTAWSARGVVAVPFYITESKKSDDRYAIGSSSAIAPFVSFDKVTNSSAALAKTNLNNLAFGLISETALTNVGHDRPVDHYFRLNGGTNMDFEGNLKSWYVRAEWEPVSTALGLNAPVGLLSATGFNISPLLKMRTEYVGQVGSVDQPIFAERREALRVGPRVGFEVQPVTGLGPGWFNSFTFVAAYSYLYDTLSSRTYSLFDSALNYNIDNDGNYALSASYRRGRLDETGATVDQIMFGLAVKLNEVPSL
jgi:hypothetical protein